MDNILHVLEVCGLSDAFEHVTSSGQPLESKPNPGYVTRFDLLGLPATSCCCVEDSVPGIAAGKAAGLTVMSQNVKTVSASLKSSPMRSSIQLPTSSLFPHLVSRPFDQPDKM